MFKFLIHLLGILAYGVGWFLCSFAIGMSHSIPYQKTFTHYLLIIFFEMLAYIALLFFLSARKESFIIALMITATLFLFGDMAWRMNWYLHNDLHGRDFLFGNGFSVGIIRLIEFTPLFILIVVTVLKEAISRSKLSSKQ